LRQQALPRTLPHFYLLKALAASMRWNKPNLRNTPHDPLGRDMPSSTAWVRNQGLEEVRKAMLASLAGLAGSEVARMSMRLRYAGDIEALWYLRADLRSTLQPLLGEASASKVMDQLTPLFHGQLPSVPRPATTPHGPH
jgi:hypothetical protein